MFGITYVAHVLTIRTRSVYHESLLVQVSAQQECIYVPMCVH